MLRDPGLALGLAERDEQEVGPRRADPIEQRGVFLGGEVAERGALGADDPEAGIAPGQRLGGLLGHALRPAQQEDAVAVAGRPLAKVEDQVRARDPLGERRSLPARRPDQGGAVGQDEGRLRR